MPKGNRSSLTFVRSTTDGVCLASRSCRRGRCRSRLLPNTTTRTRPSIRKPSQRSARTHCIQAGDLSIGRTGYPQDPVENFSLRRDLSHPRAPNRDHRGDAHATATRLLAGENLEVSVLTSCRATLCWQIGVPRRLTAAKIEESSNLAHAHLTF